MFQKELDVKENM